MKKKNIKTYGICIGGMALLLSAAFFFPQIVFGIQDKYQITKTETEERSDFNISQLNATYEKQMYERMSNFVNLNMDFIKITGIDYEGENDTELDETLKSVFAQEWIGILNEMTLGIYGTTFETNAQNIQVCKKYVVCGEGEQDRIVLVMWYLDMYLSEENMRVQILIDTETDSIYYIKITDKTGRNQNISVDYESRKEFLGTLADMVPRYAQFYRDYYEAEIDDLSIKEYVDANIEMDDREYVVTYALPYGEICLEFLFQASYVDGINPDISMGIPTVGNLIPEMMQD